MRREITANIADMQGWQPVSKVLWLCITNEYKVSADIAVNLVALSADGC